jgi:hypothetical protein
MFVKSSCLRCEDYHDRYMYFPCSRKQFGLPGPSLLEVGHDEREPDGMLASALTVRIYIRAYILHQPIHTYTYLNLYISILAVKLYIYIVSNHTICRIMYLVFSGD